MNKPFVNKILSFLQGHSEKSQDVCEPQNPLDTLRASTAGVVVGIAEIFSEVNGCLADIGKRFAHQENLNKLQDDVNESAYEAFAKMAKVVEQLQSDVSILEFKANYRPGTAVIVQPQLRTVSVHTKIRHGDAVYGASTGRTSSLTTEVPYALKQLSAPKPKTIDLVKAGRPVCGVGVTGRVAKHDMLTHPDTIYLRVATGARYRFHEGKWELKRSITSEFATARDGFPFDQFYSSSERFSRVDTAKAVPGLRPSVGTLVSGTRAARDMKENPAARYLCGICHYAYNAASGRFEVVDRTTGGRTFDAARFNDEIPTNGCTRLQDAA